MLVKFKKTCFIFLVIFLVTPKLTISLETLRNLTLENQLAYSEKIKELQKKEFWTFSGRGRPQRKPATLGAFLLAQELIISEENWQEVLNLAYLNSDNQINSLLKKSGEEIPQDVGQELKTIARNNLIKNYDLKDKIKGSNSFFEIYQNLKSAVLEFNILPVRIYLSVKTNKDLREISKKLETEEISFKNFDFLKKPFSSLSVFDLENKLTEEIKNLAKEEIKILGELKEKKIPEEKPEEIYTHTIRTKNELILIYGDKTAIERTKKFLGNLKEILDREELIKKLKEENIPGIYNIEYFFKSELEKKVITISVREAIMQDKIPIIEGLTIEEATKFLNKLGYEVEFAKEEDLENLMEKSRKKTNKFIVLTGTSATDKIIFLK